MSSSASTALKLQLQKAKEELDAGDADAALTLCKKVLSADRSNYSAYILVGVACARKGETARALQAYDRAIALKPDAPVAYKGLVDALRSVPDDGGNPELLIRRARAQVSLASISPAHADTARLGAAGTLYTLARGNAELVPEAIAAWRSLTSEDAVNGRKLPHGATRVESVVAVLEAVGSGIEVGNETFESSHPSVQDCGDLSASLDVLESLEVPLGPHESDALAQKLLVRRIKARVRAGDLSMENASRLLSRLNEDEQYLALAEEDANLGEGTGRPEISDLQARAERAMHYAGHPQNVPRAAALLAGGLSASTLSLVGTAANLVDAASAHIRAAAVKKRRATGRRVSPATDLVNVADTFSSPMECVVRGRLHIAAGEHKQCAAVALRGIALCNELGRRSRVCAVLHLVKGAAHTLDRRHDTAETDFKNALQWCEESVDSETAVWIQRAVLRWRISAAGMRTGVQDDETLSSSLGHVLASASNSAWADIAAMGRLELLWSSALEGSPELEKMEILVAGVVSVSETNPSAPSWELAILGADIVGTRKEIAAHASMRLAQVYMWKSEGVDMTCLKRAKELLMQAANYMGSLPGSYALLGWIFEVEAANGKQPSETSRKMAQRAMRCYRKSCNMNPAHALASRRLARMLANSGEKNLFDEAVAVARAVTERNPRSRWAWNVLGWSRLDRGVIAEAASAFQNALKGQGTVTRAVGSDSFGTLPGRDTASCRDKDVLVDVDSWRGLSVVYRAQGKLASACSCLEAGLNVLSEADILEAESKEFYCVLIAEKADILTDLGKATDAINLLHRTMSTNSAAVTPSSAIGTLFLRNAYLADANELWDEGWFHRSTQVRRRAVLSVVNGIGQGLLEMLQVSPAIIYKSLGDALYAAASGAQSKLTAIIPQEEVKNCFLEVNAAYSHAIHYAPWDAKRNGAVDLGSCLAKQAELEADNTKARLSVRVLSGATGISTENGSNLAKAIHIMGRTEAQPNLCHAARHFLSSVIEGETTDEMKLESAAGLVEMCASERDERGASEYALLALRIDATNWRAWYATGLAREADGDVIGWTAPKIQSTIDAFVEAERLGGGGPVVAAKLSESLERHVIHMNASKGKDDANINERSIGNQAAAALAAAVRGGTQPPPVSAEAVRVTARRHMESEFARKVKSKEALQHEFPFHAKDIEGMK
jgi:tetratricopeptide (TPR) repeat protein